jgi:hypothetical protein
MKTIDNLKTYIIFGTKLCHLTWKKKLKCKTCHEKSEKKKEFGNLWNVSLGVKCGTPITLGPKYYNSITNFIFQKSLDKNKPIIT